MPQHKFYDDIERERWKISWIVSGPNVGARKLFAIKLLLSPPMTVYTKYLYVWVLSYLIVTLISFASDFCLTFCLQDVTFFIQEYYIIWPSRFEVSVTVTSSWARKGIIHVKLSSIDSIGLGSKNLQIKLNLNRSLFLSK